MQRWYRGYSTAQHETATSYNDLRLALVTFSYSLINRTRRCLCQILRLANLVWVLFVFLDRGSRSSACISDTIETARSGSTLS